MNQVFASIASSALMAISALGSVASAAEAVASASQSIDWRRDDVDAAFKEAKASGKPIFIYWGSRSP